MSRSSPPIIQQAAPAATDPAVEEAIRKERELAQKRKGRRSTILTGAQGVQEEKSTLLGG